MAVYKRALRTFDTASLSASFQNIGASVGFPVKKVSIVNTASVGVLITDQSSQDDIEVPGGGTLSVGEGLSNENGTSTGVIFPANVQLQVKQVTASGAGKLIINCFG